MSSSEQTALPQSRQPMPGSPEPAPPGRPIRSPAQIERDIEARRQRLSGTIDEIADRVKPQNVARRKVEDVRNRITDDEGNVRREVVAVAAGVAVVVVALIVLQRRRS